MWVVKEGKQLDARYTFHKDTGSSVVSSLHDRNKLNSQDKLRIIGSSLALHTSVLMLFTGSTGPVVYTFMLWEGQKKATCESTVYIDLVIYSHMLDVPG